MNTGLPKAIALLTLFCSFEIPVALSSPDAALAALRRTTADLSQALESEVSRVALERMDATLDEVQQSLSDFSNISDAGHSFDVSESDTILDTTDSVVPVLPVSCAMVRVRLSEARFELTLLTSLIHQLMTLIDHGTIPDSVMTAMLNQVLSLSRRIELTYPSSWDEKSFVITRHWAKPLPPATLDDEHCNEVNLTHLPMSMQSWSAMEPVSILWQGLEWSKESLPPEFSFTANPDGIELLEKASLTHICLEPRHVQLKARLVAPSSTSPLAPPAAEALFVFRSRRGGNG